MLNENQEKIIKEKFNTYMNNIKIPENLEGIIMEDMNKIENDEMNENQNSKKKFSATKAIGIAAAVVIVAGVVGVTGLKIGIFDDKSKKTVIAENHSESGRDIKTASGDKIKSLYDIEEYTSNLTDASNGKLAFLKLLENDELQTEKHEDYYTYIDQFENKYNINEITNVTSESGTMGVDNWAALFKVTVTYVDNNNKTNTMYLAIVLLPNHEVQNEGTYDNFTGTTSYVKGFTNLYNNDKVSEERASGDKIKSLYDIEEYTSNLTDASNGKLAFLKLLENDELQTETHEDYYTYIDQFENKYNINEITNITSEAGTMGVDNWAALFKVTVTYVDNNNKTNTMYLAIVLLPNHEVQNEGTYDNFTGTTSYVKGFTNLYNYDNDKVSEERIRELADMFLKTNYVGFPTEILEYLGFNVSGKTIKKFSDGTYELVRLNVKYDDYKNKLLEYFSIDFFERIQSDDNIEPTLLCYKFDTDNGYLTIIKTGGDPGNDTEIVSINKVSSNKYKINYKYNTRGDKSNIYKASMFITVKLENGKYVISDIEEQ